MGIIFFPSSYSGGGGGRGKKKVCLKAKVALEIIGISIHLGHWVCHIHGAIPKKMWSLVPNIDSAELNRPVA